MQDPSDLAMRPESEEVSHPSRYWVTGGSFPVSCAVQASENGWASEALGRVTPNAEPETVHVESKELEVRPQEMQDEEAAPVQETQ